MGAERLGDATGRIARVDASGSVIFRPALCLLASLHRVAISMNAERPVGATERATRPVGATERTAEQDGPGMISGARLIAWLREHPESELARWMRTRLLVAEAYRIAQAELMAPTLDEFTLLEEAHRRRARGQAKSSALERLLARIEPEPNSGCWLTHGPVNWNGYTLINAFDGTKWRNGTAHRLAYRELVGPIPTGALVLHRCNVKACVNPRHLYLGSKKDNAIDISRIGRPGSRALRLDAPSVQEIRRLLALGIPRREIAHRFGIAKPTVKDVARGRTWRWVP